MNILPITLFQAQSWRPPTAPWGRRTSSTTPTAESPPASAASALVIAGLVRGWSCALRPRPR